MKKRIGFLFVSTHYITDYSDLIKGWEIIIYDYSQHLIKEGYEPIWLSCRSRSIEDRRNFDGIIVANLRYNSRLWLLVTPSLIAKLIKVIKAEEIKVLYARVSSLAFPAALACKIARIPFIFHVEDFEADLVSSKTQNILQYGLNRMIMLFFQKSSIIMSKRIVIVSESFKDFLVNNWSISKEKIDVIYEGAEKNNSFSNSSSCPRKIVYVGGTSYHDGIDLLLKAYAMFANKIENIELVVATFRPKEDIIHFEELCSSLGIAGRVRFVASLTGKEAREVVRNSYVGVICRRRTLSTNLTTSSAVFLYLSEGVPVVVPKLKAITEIIRDPSLLFEPENSESLSNSLVQILSNEKLREELRNYTLELKNKFERDKMCNKLTKIIIHEFE